MRELAKFLKDLWRATKEGLPMSRRFFWTAFQVVLVIIAILGVGIAPWKIPQIDDTFLRAVAWFAVLAIVVSVTVSIGLAPFLGQRRITAGVFANYLDLIKSSTDQIHALRQELEPLGILKKQQRDQIRQYIHPILVKVELRPDDAYVTLAFVSLLVFEEEITRLVGRLHFETGLHVDCEFRPCPRRLPVASISNTFSESVLLPDSVKRLLEKLRESEGRTSDVRLTLRMERKTGDPIDFDPPNDHALRLYVGRTIIYPVSNQSGEDTGNGAQAGLHR